IGGRWRGEIARRRRAARRGIIAAAVIAGRAKAEAREEGELCLRRVVIVLLIVGRRIGIGHDIFSLWALRSRPASCGGPCGQAITDASGGGLRFDPALVI